MSFKEKMFFLIVLYTQTLIIVLLFGIFAHRNPLYKIEEWALRLLYNGFASDYAELLKKSGKAKMEMKCLRCLAL